MRLCSPKEILTLHDLQHRGKLPPAGRKPSGTDIPVTRRPPPQGCRDFSLPHPNHVLQRRPDSDESSKTDVPGTARRVTHCGRDIGVISLATETSGPASLDAACPSSHTLSHTPQHRASRQWRPDRLGQDLIQPAEEEVPLAPVLDRQHCLSDIVSDQLSPNPYVNLPR